MVKDRSNLSLKISETSHGDWFYAVFTDDGSEPGSLLSASVARELDDAVRLGTKALQRELMIRACDHFWVSWGTTGIPRCSKCRIVDWTEDE
jgi:hypothetical protein